MLNRQGLHALLNIEVHHHAPTFIIYSRKASPRLEHACEFIFKHVLKVNYIITADLPLFQQSSFFKINYSAEALLGIVQIFPHNLLFETSISELKPEPFFKNGLIYFYQDQNGDEKERLHFDIFAAVFYFISRYEEWQEFKKDQHQRFEAEASLLYQHRFHLKPVADHWIVELESFLLGAYKQLEMPEKKFRAISTIDVDNLYAFKSKGFLRTSGACLKDLLKGDFKNLAERLKVISNKKNDPFDIYDSISSFCFENQVPLIYFFLLRTGTVFDRTVNPASDAFKKVFRRLKSNKALAGLHPSYHSAFKNELLDEEMKIFSEKSGEPVSLSRQHYLRFDIRTTPRLLFSKGILADFTMGFASTAGFRAGTSYPFFYYDFSIEKKLDFLMVPFCAMDGAYTVYQSKGTDEAFREILLLAAEVKKVNGLFITVFHERTFYDRLYPGFGTLYRNIYRRLKDL